MNVRVIHEDHDIIILGAGINGCGIAAELAHRNKHILVLERSAIGSGTSSKSSQLIHGGLRYLETGKIGLVREALIDRQELLVKYPELVKLKPFYLPVYKTSPRPGWMIRSGLRIYDLLSGKYSEYGSGKVSKDDFLELAPSLHQNDLKAVYRYYDGKTDDLQLTRRIARDAQQAGAEFHEHIRVNSITTANGEYNIATSRGEFSAPVLINATGPWIDEVNQSYGLPARYGIRKISGIHIIIEGLLTSNLMFMQTRQKRIFFIIPEPEYNRTIIGTTEREETVTCDEVDYNNEDIQYLLDNINEYLVPEKQLAINDVHDVWIGIRPLIASKDNPTDLSREYALDLHTLAGAQLLHVFGGKLTTFLSLARKTANLLKL